MSKQGVVNIHGREYLTVAHRLNWFRETHSIEDGWSIRTWPILNEGDRVIIQATICDKDDHVVATGLAEEIRGANTINKTSHIEVCETSAIGRALAAAGYLGGAEYASADELVTALANQDKPVKEERKPKEAKREKKEAQHKPRPEERIEKYLDLIAQKLGPDETMKRWTNHLRFSEWSHGNLSLAALLSDKDVTSSDLWEISNGAKEMYEALMRVIEAEKEDNDASIA